MSAHAAGMQLCRSNAKHAGVLLVTCAALIVANATAHAQTDRSDDAPSGDASIGLAAYNTSCYQLQNGGPICRGSLAGEQMSTCYLDDGCRVAYGGVVVTLAHYVRERVAIAGEVAFYRQIELTPTNSASSLAIGPRIRLGRLLGQVLIGRQWHQLFSDGLLVQPGAAIDLGGKLGPRFQVDYTYFPSRPVLSGLRLHAAFVAHVGMRGKRRRESFSAFAPAELIVRS